MALKLYTDGMIKFLLTNWWIYIPIIAVLGFLTFRNNQKIKYIKRDKEIRALPPEERQRALQAELRRKPSKFESFTSKYGLRGILSHIFPKR